MLNFLNLSKNIFGLEITDTNIRIMKMKRERGWLKAAMAGCVPLEDGVVRNGQIQDEAKLAAAIKDLTARVFGSKKETRYAVVSLPEDRAFFQVFSMPRLNVDELRAAVVFEAENYIPLPLEKVYIDFEPVVSADADNRRREVAVAALPRELVDSRVRAVGAAGITPIAMELESQAAVRAALVGRVLKSPTMIVQIGDAHSSIIIYSRDSIRFVFSIPISNRYFLETIAAAAGVDMERAEELKAECGIGDFSRFFDDERTLTAEGEKRKVFEALIPGMIDFSQQIQRCVRYYQTHDESVAFEKKGFDKIMICGSGSNLKGLEEFLSLKLNSPVEKMVLAVGVDADDFKNFGFFEDNTFGCAVVAGLAMRELDAQRGQAAERLISLAPPSSAGNSFLPKRAKKRSLKRKK